MEKIWLPRLSQQPWSCCWGRVHQAVKIKPFPRNRPCGRSDARAVTRWSVTPKRLAGSGSEPSANKTRIHVLASRRISRSAGRNSPLSRKCDRPLLSAASAANVSTLFVWSPDSRSCGCQVRHSILLGRSDQSGLMKMSDLVSRTNKRSR